MEMVPLVVGATVVLSICVTGFGSASDFNRSAQQQRARGGVSSVPPMPLVAAAQTLWLLHWFSMPPLAQSICSSMSWSMGRVPLFGLGLFDGLDKSWRGAQAAPLSNDSATSQLRALLYEQAFGIICATLIVAVFYLLAFLSSFVCPPKSPGDGEAAGRSGLKVIADSLTLYALHFGHAGACELCARAFLMPTDIFHEPIALAIVVVLAAYAGLVWPAVFGNRLYSLRAETFKLPPTMEIHKTAVETMEAIKMDDMIAYRVRRADSGCCCFPCHGLRGCFAFSSQQRWDLRLHDAMLMPFVGALKHSSRMHALYTALRLGFLSVLVSLPVCGDAGSPVWSPSSCHNTSFWTAVTCAVLASIHLFWLCVNQPYTRGYDLFMMMTDEICLVCILVWWSVGDGMAGDSNLEVILIALLFLPIAVHLIATLLTTCMSSEQGQTQSVRLKMMRAAVQESLDKPEFLSPKMKVSIRKLFSGPSKKTKVFPMAFYDDDTSSTSSDTDTDSFTTSSTDDSD